MITKPNRVPLLRRGAVTLRAPEARDEWEFTEAAKNSRELHDELVHPPETAEAFETYRRRNELDANLCFLVIENSSGGIAGAVNLSQISKEPLSSAYLGYYLFDGYTGRGLMAEAISAVVEYALGEFGLHRLEANIQPRNEASIRLVKRCGFTREGFSRKYLRIAGDWRDHERWAIIREDL